MTRAPRILTVTPNPAVDVTYTVGRQEIGSTVRVSDVQRRPGGKGLNVARVLRSLGRDVATLQPLGGDTGAWIERELTASGMPVIACTITATTRTTVAVVDGVAHPTLFAEAGPALSAAEWSDLAGALTEAVEPGDWVVIAGSFPPGSTPADLQLLVHAARARQARVAVDTSGALLLAAAESGATLVKANESEIAEATGIGDRDAALAALGRGGATVMMSLGADGALLRTPGGRTHRRGAVTGVDGNPTGAGDAATAGLVAALADERDAEVALAWAAVCGAAAVLSPVAGEIDVHALRDLAARAGLPLDDLPFSPSPDRSIP